METNINSYKLDQGNKVYIYTTSIIGNNILRMACYNSSNQNKKFIRDFTIENLNQIDEIFSSLKSPNEASDYIDKILNSQKVSVIEENGILKIRFYISNNGVTNQIDIPLNDSNPGFLENNGNQFLQEGNIQNLEGNNFLGKPTGQNDIEALLNSAFSQNNQDINLDNKDNNQYFPEKGNYNEDKNIYDEPNPLTNSYGINEFINSNNNNYNNPQIIGNDENFENKYYPPFDINNSQSTSILNNNSQFNFGSNQYFGTLQNNENTNNNFFMKETQGFENKPSIGEVGNVENNINNINIDEELKQFLNQQNTNAEINQIESQNYLKNLNNIKYLPIQTSSRVLPPLGPFTSLQGLDLHKLANINSQKNSNIMFQPIQNMEENNYQNPQNIQTENKFEELKLEYQQNFTTEQATANLNIDSNEKPNSNINNNNNIIKKIEKNTATKKQIKKNESEEIKILKNQLAELEPLKKKVAEMEVLRGQLTELNALRAQVAEYNAIKDQFKNINSQIEKLRIENQQLKIKVEELENVNIKYEEEIKILKQKEKINDKNNKLDKIEEKDVIYEENSQDMTVKGDIIHNGFELDLLTKKINKSNKKLTLNLLYKATADSDKAEAFHAKCDEAESTIVLVETDKGKRFGGYTTCSWSGDCIDKRDEEAFVFSLDKMLTYDNIPGEDAIGCYPKFGPIFLGCQIRIYDNFFTKGGTTFESGLNFDTEEDFELNGGERVFNVKEIEVYEVIKE